MLDNPLPAPHTHHPPLPAPARGLPRCAQPARCGLAAGSPPLLAVLLGTGFLSGVGFSFSFGRGWEQAFGSGCLRGLGCLSSETRGRNSRGEGACSSNNLSAASPVSPLTPCHPSPMSDGHPPSTTYPRSISGDPPSLPGSAPEWGLLQWVMFPPHHQPRFPSSNPSPGARTQPRSEGQRFVGGDSCCEFPPTPSREP